MIQRPKSISGVWRHWNIEGQILFEGTFKKDELIEFTKWFGNGNLRSQVKKIGDNIIKNTVWYNNGLKECKGLRKKDKFIFSLNPYGVESGYWNYWYKNGKLKMRGKYHVGNKVDKWSYFNKDGSLKVIKSYDEFGNLLVTKKIR